MALNWADLLAGAIGGAPCVYVGQPFDTVKTRLQTRPDAYAGMWNCLRRTVRGEGVTALWKGTSPALFVSVMENAVLFTANGTMQRALGAFSGRTPDQLSVWECMAVGGAAGVINAGFICPPEVVKCRLQAQGAGSPRSATLPAVTRYSGPMDCALKTLKTEGISGLFRGMTALIAREIPFNALFFGCYEAYCKAFLALGPAGRTSKSELTPLEIVAAGGGAGMTSWGLVYPFDAIKTRIQVATNASASTVIAQAYKAHGIRVFYSGVGVTLIRAFPVNAALFFSVESVKKHMPFCSGTDDVEASFA